MPRVGQRAARIERLARALHHEIIHQRIARPGIEGENFIAFADPRHIRHTANIHNRHGTRQSIRQRPRAVIQRQERRALPARLYIRAAKIGNDINPGCSGQRIAIADLQRKAVIRVMRNRLPVKADDIDIIGAGFRLLQQPLGRARMQLRQ